MTSDIKAPYNFVPLSNWIFSPSWAEQISHDVPFEDGLSGCLKVNLKMCQPLMIAGEIAPAHDASKTPQSIQPLREPVSGNPVIPGSSLKGMLRNVLQIASFGKITPVNDSRFGVRDLAAKGPGKSIRDPNVNFYLNQMGRANGGFLKYQNGQWLLTPCSWARIKQKTYTEWAGITEKDWFNKNNLSPVKRYQLLDKGDNIRDQQGDFPKQLTVSVEEDPDSYPINGKKGLRAKLDSHGKPSFLVVTGQPKTKGAWNFTKLQENKAKNNDFVFFDLQNSNLVVSERVIQDFLFINSNKNPQNKEPIWDFWKNRITIGNGVPVFWKENDDGSVKSLGLSSMYRLAYDNSVADVIGHTSSGHNNETIYDLADVIFGCLDTSIKSSGSLRGRINITTARATRWNMAEAMTTVLSSPKATYYPNYLVQSSSRHEYSTMFDSNSEIRGWKRYPVRSSITPIPLNSESSYKVCSVLNPIDKGAEFNFRIHFHNLKPVELGALIWAVNWGGNKQALHSLGMAKSLGFGSCRLEIDELTVDQGDAAVLSESELTALYESFITDAIKNSSDTNDKPKFHDTAQYQALLAMAVPDRVAVGHMVMEERNNQFADAKEVKNNELAYPIDRTIQASWLKAPKVTNEHGESVAAVIALGGGSSKEALEKQERALSQKRELEEMPESIRFMQEKVSWVLGQKANSAQPGDAYFSEILGYLTEPPEVLNNPQDMKYLAHVCYLLCKEKAGGKWSSKKYEKTHGRSRKQKANELMAGDMISEEDIREYYKL